MKAKKIIISLIVIIFIGGYLYMNPILPIITGYSAKNLSSGLFVANRTQESLENIDLNFSFIKFNKNKVDYKNKEVTSSFLWHTSKAVYIDGFGCTLVNDATVDEIQNRSYSTPISLPFNPDTIAWPMGNLISDTIPKGIDINKLNTTIDLAFTDTVPYKGTFATIVVYKGQPVIERYKDGFSAENKYLSWSMAKSFTNALVGILVKEGKLDINKPIGLNEWLNDERKNITLSNLLKMNSGLKWNENYGNNSDVNIMLHKVGDMGKYTLQKDAKFKNDSVWLYSSGTTNLVCKIIRNSFEKEAEYYEFPRKALFNKIGMKSAIWELDASGTFIGSSYIYATMQDYARFGLLYLNNGNWLGEQLLPADWVNYTTTVSNGSEGQYGAFFYLNKNGIDFPDAPKDMLLCRGHDGQFIFIIPSKELVVVRTGFSKRAQFNYNDFIAGICNSITTD